ncbi:Crp/Fnr family transcriptional regulator [Soonwooa sp.]|uniref:Crp/Fnr family transcriptional regulator n=1 Tax=Soonwooa sp. TaxID=1938592 RepID=UPI0026270580|nr:Crp/Fnr family transcriptional regulator [Soonwooa sp.]
MITYREYLELAGIKMSDDDWEIYEPRLEKVDYKKGDLIIKQGDVEDYLSVITKGIARYYIEKDDKEITLNFVFEHNYFSAYESFLTRKPSPYNIEALTDVSLWRSSYESFKYFHQHASIGNYLGRIAAEGLYLRKAEREISFLTETAEQRYLYLLEKDKNLLQKVPLKYIASYIGVTPQALSRIRKRIS